MQRPTGPKASGVARSRNDHGRASIVRFPGTRRQYSTCHICGDSFVPRQAWHRQCPQCFYGNRVYRALARYREAQR